MTISASIKKSVRKRDNHRCTECGMTAKEHKRRFGRTLHVHRTHFNGPISFGPYESETCITICQRCHQAKHSFKCAIRKRDGFACTECGMTDEEHHSVYKSPLPVHCDRGERCDEWVWESIGVREDECYTLCSKCHFSKHSIWPVVLNRDRLKCKQCGKQPEDNRSWSKVLTVHRIEGYCDEKTTPSTDATGYLTLCRECHQEQHPDKFGEYIRYGFELQLPRIVREHGDKLGVSLPITCKEQLGVYKEYLIVVNYFIDYFWNTRIPKKSGIRSSITNLPDTQLSAFVRREAAKEAIRWISFSQNIPLTRKETAKLQKMSEEEKSAFMREREHNRIEFTKTSNSEPTLTFRVGNRSIFVEI